MNEAMDYLVRALVIGAGATAFMDAVTVVRTRLSGTPSLDYKLVGRWLIYVTRARFRHDPISASPPVRGEQVVGWSAHYLIGVAFAGILLILWNIGWTCRPTIGPALIVGIGSVLAPFLIMQPGMGAGIAASRTPRPAAARFRSLVTHMIFGVGLYVAGVLANSLGIFPCE